MRAEKERGTERERLDPVEGAALPTVSAVSLYRPGLVFASCIMPAPVVKTSALKTVVKFAQQRGLLLCGNNTMQMYRTASDSETTHFSLEL